MTGVKNEESWSRWSAAGAVANLIMSAGIIAESGPLVPGGGWTYILYFLTAVWQVSVPTVMIRRFGKPVRNIIDLKYRTIQ